MRCLTLFLLAVFAVSCKKETAEKSPSHGITDGIYMGSIQFQGQRYFSQIHFIDGTFEEYASGGVMYQKMPNCLTEGNYSIQSGAIRFNPKSLPEKGSAPCTPEMELSGAYSYYIAADSVSFWRTARNVKVEYTLKKMAL
jgi:hypothetical protein